jgi:hypothetical protein
LSWRSDWGRYPTADLDLLIVNPLGETTAITSLDSPERVSIPAPVPGEWKISVHGFAIPHMPDCDGDGEDCDDDEGERFEMRVSADGRILRPRR